MTYKNLLNVASDLVYKINSKMLIYPQIPTKKHRRILYTKISYVTIKNIINLHEKKTPSTSNTVVRVFQISVALPKFL